MSTDAPYQWDPGDALDALGDPTCRRILTETTSEPLTARELVERCNESRSTVYRKIRTLAENDLIDESNRIRIASKDATQFEPAVDSLRIDFTDENGITLEDAPSDHDASPPPDTG